MSSSAATYPLLNYSKHPQSDSPDATPSPPAPFFPASSQQQRLQPPTTPLGLAQVPVSAAYPLNETYWTYNDDSKVPSAEAAAMTPAVSSTPSQQHIFSFVPQTLYLDDSLSTPTPASAFNPTAPPNTAATSDPWSLVSPAGVVSAGAELGLTTGLGAFPIPSPSPPPLSLSSHTSHTSHTSNSHSQTSHAHPHTPHHPSMNPSYHPPSHQTRRPGPLRTFSASSAFPARRQRSATVVSTASPSSATPHPYSAMAAAYPYPQYTSPTLARTPSAPSMSSRAGSLLDRGGGRVYHPGVPLHADYAELEQLEQLGGLFSGGESGGVAASATTTGDVDGDGANVDKGASVQRATSKQPRFKPTKEQLEILIAAYEKNKNPDGPTRDALATILGSDIRPKTLQIWFQNRRSKARARERNDGKRPPRSAASTTVSSPVADPGIRSIDMVALRTLVHDHDAFLSLIPVFVISISEWTRFLTPIIGLTVPDLAAGLRSHPPQLQFYTCHAGDTYRVTVPLTRSAVSNIHAAVNPRHKDSVALRFDLALNSATFDRWARVSAAYEAWDPVADFTGGRASMGGVCELTGDREVLLQACARIQAMVAQSYQSYAEYEPNTADTNQGDLFALDPAPSPLHALSTTISTSASVLMPPPHPKIHQRQRSFSQPNLAAAVGAIADASGTETTRDYSPLFLSGGLNYRLPPTHNVHDGSFNHFAITDIGNVPNLGRGQTSFPRATFNPDANGPGVTGMGMGHGLVVGLNNMGNPSLTSLNGIGYSNAYERYETYVDTTALGGPVHQTDIFGSANCANTTTTTSISGGGGYGSSAFGFGGIGTGVWSTLNQQLAVPPLMDSSHSSSGIIWPGTGVGAETGATTFQFPIKRNATPRDMSLDPLPGLAVSSDDGEELEPHGVEVVMDEESEVKMDKNLGTVTIKGKEEKMDEVLNLDKCLDLSRGLDSDMDMGIDMEMEMATALGDSACGGDMGELGELEYGSVGSCLSSPFALDGTDSYEGTLSD